MAMASSKFMPSTSSSSSPNSDLISHPHHHHHHPILPDFQPPPPPPPDPTHLLHATDISLIDAAGAIHDAKTVDDVWREIVAGKNNETVECKVEAGDEMMTLEDFLAKAGAGEEDGDDVAEDHVEDVKVFGGYDCGSNGGQMMMMYGPGGPGGVPVGGVMGYGNGGGSGGMEHLMGGGGGGGGVRGKRRGGPILEPLDKAAQQRQRRMIKNRESAARSRERKQAYQVELESLASKLEEENEQLLREKAEQSKERLKQLMEKVIPVVEKKRPPRALRRVRSMQW